MAQGKKSFLLYCDLIGTFEELTDDEAGKLIKHVLRYVNDMNPDAPDRLTKITFEPIKQALKRDLVKYEQIREKKRFAGLASAESRKQIQQVLTGVDTPQHKATHSTVIDSVSDSVSDSVIVSDIDKEKKNILLKKREEAVASALVRKKQFYNSLIPFLDKYPKEMLKAFYDYWSEMNKTQTKMLFEFKPTFEISKRLATWHAKDSPNSGKTFKSESTQRKEDAQNLQDMAVEVLKNAQIDLTKI